ncbi:pectate lyase 1 [Bimuria novae-zelandiae CBS 107.79]|uniref:pectate lyase n=1 Tax=Bimuria novae-zelandiae CBS 107.79 TaxID=1447943 RepID=A0A6A5VPG0_9PLEO|nr:pectate lyase 1 [Bimuria novae-zelandiae CBS 107.79]
MKLSSFLPLGLSALALAAPTHIVKRYPYPSRVHAAATTGTGTPSIPSGNSTGTAPTGDGPIGYASQNGGTTGGAGGSAVTVASLAELTEAVKGEKAAEITITSSIKGNGENVKVGSNKTVRGKDSSVILENFTITVKDAKNVIIQNLAIQKVVGGDAIAVQKSTNVWLDHLDLSSDRDHDKDYYDGLLDLTHAADFITVSNTKLHDHWKASLIGHSDSNEAEDKGFLHVTYYNNHWENINSRGPSIRFGTGHFFNNYYKTVSDGINTRLGAQVLVENNVFIDSSKPLYSVDNDAGAVEKGNDFGGATNTAPEGTLTSVPYEYSLIEAAAVEAAVVGKAGNTLTF